LHDPPSPREKWALTPESFDRLLLWLHHDRDQAGLKYEEIRARLIKRFRQLGCHEAEELANKTIDRVAGKLPEVIGTYKGDPEPYFFRTAFYVHKEYLRKPIIQSLATVDFRDPATPSSEETELLDSCLRHCLDELDQEKRDMILEYYRGDRQVKMQARKALAERLGITLPNLRLRAQRVRSTLRQCILDCMERKAIGHHY
jgi:DNA-directed RNA polymerase specialized sigma24 family protein